MADIALALPDKLADVEEGTSSPPPSLRFSSPKTVLLRPWGGLSSWLPRSTVLLASLTDERELPLG